MADKIMILDIEVENHEYFGRFASPRHPDNYVVMKGWAIDSPDELGEIQYSYYESKEQAKNWLEIPEDVWAIVCHNAGFEIEWMHTQQPKVLHEFLKRGGVVFCTSLAEYLLTGQQHTYPSLDQVAPKYGGTTKIDEVKLLWDMGKLTSEIDPELLSEYLAGPGGDINNTRLAFYGQWEKMEELGMLEGYMLRCDALLFNAISEANGLKVDREVAFANKAALEAELDELLETFKQHQQEFPEELVFNLGSHHHKSAWVFGGPIKYRARVPSFDREGRPKWVKYDCVKATTPDGEEELVDATGIEDEELEAWAEAEGLVLDRYVRGKNAGKIKRTREDSNVQAEVWGEKVYQCPGIIPLDSLDPGFVREFKKENTLKITHHDGSPIYSTNEDTIKALSIRRDIPEESKEIIQGLTRWGAINKDLGSFYLKEKVDDDGNVVKQSGALQYLTDDNFIHHKLNNTSTVTTRLSSSNPNMQQLPQKSKSNVKAMFVSRFGKDGALIEADYSNLEVIVLAALSKDKNLAEFILSGRSMHTLNAANTLGITYEEYEAVLKDRHHPDHDRYAQLREDHKPREFAANYGATPPGIAYAAGCTLEEAQAFLDNKARQFPKAVVEFPESVYQEASERTTTSREMMDDGTYRMVKTGYYQADSGTLYAFRQAPSTVYHEGRRVNVMDFRMQEIKNYPIQGEAAFFVQAACGWVVRWLIEKDFYGGLAVPINTVHDAIYIDCHKSVLQEVADNLKEIMESIPEGVAHVGYDLTLPFPVEVTAGANLLDQMSVEEFLNHE